MSIRVTSPAFHDGGRIPVKYTQDGENVSPPLSWSMLPPGTQDVAIIVDDPDAPKPEPFVHWLCYHVDPKASGLPEGISMHKNDGKPIGNQGVNALNHAHYDGPAPPMGHGTHHYHFKVYALDTKITNPGKLSKKLLLEAMAGHILDEGELVGTYERGA
jgi:Raf kinase inhibitor-like YbhB/YbcL family protein